jgi:hypothetical protein
MNYVYSKIKSIVKSIPKEVPKNDSIITSLGVRMRNPIKNGLWIGWTGEEVAEHLASINRYKATLPPQPKSYGNGC